MRLALHGTIARGDMRRSVDLEVMPGEVVAIMGRNGTGKTTLVRTIAGLHRLDTGTLTVDDEVWDDSVARWTPPQQRRAGLVMQRPSLFPRRKVISNVAYAARTRGTTRRESRAEALAWLERVGAAHLSGRSADTLSGGETQRVAIARALAATPRLLLLDEPLSAVDPRSVPALTETIRSVLADFGGGAVVVLHDEAVASALADRILHLEFTPGR